MIALTAPSRPLSPSDITEMTSSKPRKEKDFMICLSMTAFMFLATELPCTSKYQFQNLNLVIRYCTAYKNIEYFEAFLPADYSDALNTFDFGGASQNLVRTLTSAFTDIPALVDTAKEAEASGEFFFVGYEIGDILNRIFDNSQPS